MSKSRSKMAAAAEAVSATPSILFVGERGVGKSFLINSFPFYLSHQTLNEVRSSNVQCVIRTEFTLTDDDDVVHQIQDGGEEQSPDPFACNTFEVTLANQIIRMIECPTITVNQEANRKIIENIVKFVSDELHSLMGIIFVLNSNQVKLESYFRSSFQSLLSYFHKSAADKIMFAFTFSDGSCFKPGNVRKALEELVSDHAQLQLGNNNTFSVDSKWLRYVIAEKHAVQFAPDEIDSCQRAWLKSQKECARMWRSMIEKQPYATRETKIIKDVESIILVSTPFLRKTLKQSKLLAEDLSTREEFRNAHHQQIKRSVSQQITNVVCTFCEQRICCYDCKIGSNLLRYYCAKFEFMSGICKVCGCHLEKHLKKPDVRVKLPEAAIVPYMDESIELLHEEKRKMEQEYFAIEFTLNKLSKYLESNAIGTPSSEIIDKDNLNLDITSPDVNEIAILKEKLFYLDLCGKVIRQSYNKFHNKT